MKISKVHSYSWTAARDTPLCSYVRMFVRIGWTKCDVYYFYRYFTYFMDVSYTRPYDSFVSYFIYINGEE